jgi:hypothetical protein
MSKGTMTPMIKKRHPLSIIFLSFITFGIYYLYIIYQTTRTLQIILPKNKDRRCSDAGLCVLFSLVIPFYLPYWLYVTNCKIKQFSLDSKLPTTQVNPHNNYVFHLTILLSFIGVLLFICNFFFLPDKQNIYLIEFGLNMSETAILVNLIITITNMQNDMNKLIEYHQLKLKAQQEVAEEQALFPFELNPQQQNYFKNNNVSKAKYCPQCGERTDNISHFCHRCGSNLDR